MIKVSSITLQRRCFSFPSCASEPIIRFIEAKFSVSEPKEAGAVATVKIPVVRVGDTSKVSVVRVHTKDGSAISGEDYYPVSEGTAVFKQLWLNAVIISALLFSWCFPISRKRKKKGKRL